MASKTIHIRLVRSAIGRPKRQKATLKALGLRKLNQVVTKPDVPFIQGMVRKVSHLVDTR